MSVRRQKETPRCSQKRRPCNKHTAEAVTTAKRKCKKKGEDAVGGRLKERV
jgi:hypothetical protein